MTTKAKLKFADYIIRLMTCPRSVELWKIKAAEAFLKSGAKVSKKGIKEYIKTLGLTGCHSPSEIEAVLYGLITQKPERQKPVKEPETTSELRKHQLSDDVEDSLNAFGRWLIQIREFSINTARSYSWSARNYLEMFQTVSQKDAIQYKQYLLSTGLNHKTINIRMSGVLAYAKFLGKNLEIKRLKVPRSIECNNVPSEEDMRVYLEYVRAKNLYWYLMSRCLSTTGLRVHELLKITYGDILKGSVVLIGKGGKPRRIFFQDRFVEEIKEYLGTRNTLAGERICPKTPRGVAQQINAYSKQAGLDSTKFHPHAFRHYFAKQYLKRNPSDIVGLQNLLGHSSIETTSIYLQRSYEEQLADYHNNVTWQ